MAPIRDWTGAITISPLPYCEIAAGGFGVGIATAAPLRGSSLRLWRSALSQPGAGIVCGCVFK